MYSLIYDQSHSLFFSCFYLVFRVFSFEALEFMMQMNENTKVGLIKHFFHDLRVKLMLKVCQKIPQISAVAL